HQPLGRHERLPGDLRDRPFGGGAEDVLHPGRRPDAAVGAATAPGRGLGMRRAGLAAALALVALLVFPAVAEACNGWSEPDMETQLMCPTCHQVLAYSQSTIATNIRAHLHQWCGAGWTSGQV